MQKDTYSFARECYIMAKPASAKCNLACHYCYYSEKSRLYQGAATSNMSLQTLERFVEQYIAMQTTDHVLFTWHGGEPLLRPLSFYQKALELQKKYANGKYIDNCLQTNGTLLTPEWCNFLHSNNWLVGISIDGTESQHNHFRSTHNGKGTFRQVMEGISMMQCHGVEWNAMATVNSFNSLQPLEFYRFFRNINCTFLQFSPVVERSAVYQDGRHLSDPDESDMPVEPFSVTPQAWGEFCCAVFDEWVRHDVGKVFVQLFDATLANWLGVTPGVCSLAKECGHAGVIEANGDVYSCDHFVFPKYKLGNIGSDNLISLMYSPQQNAFSYRKRLALPRQCKQCRWLFACHGECPRNRFLMSKDGEYGLNYLCEGYKTFFSHVAPYMDTMAELYRQGRPPADIMQML